MRTALGIRVYDIKDDDEMVLSLLSTTGIYNKKSHGSIAIKDHRWVTGPYRLQKKANAVRFSPKLR
ncbi:hypothetical protein BGX28_006790, partial [Mortierella sp. GBA30]